ncbi:MAG: DUF4149 domain-containing protein [Sulfuritalea sp.]|nr:DUF4149 domain-containing protein [Sulfuritalea sp.]
MLAIGFVAAPVLFTQLTDRSVAGNLAGTMFSVISWVGLACGTYLTLFLVFIKGRNVKTSSVFWIILLMLCLTVVGHFGVQPILAQLQADALPSRIMQSDLRDRFVSWHRVSAVLFILQTLLGIALVVLQERGRTR